ncbi:hypothetical protein [Ruegeria halocynthiae]|uniref:hypothetical protein n=1 Tax=Ruegeria halocynthiae TaxID=985054 RepID=UPI0005668587|nr:hypothetical protein [Ruegeria halocynthiae]
MPASSDHFLLICATCKGGQSASALRDALAEFAAQFQHSTDGWTNATDRPRALLTKTLSRMPRIAKENLK